MEVLVVVLVVIAGVALLRHRGRQQTDTSRGRAGRDVAFSAPPAPAGQYVRLASDGRVAVVGESHYQRALRDVARGRVSGEGLAGNIPVSAVLVPEPTNRHDRNAVRVDVDGRTVGYLAREVAVQYQPVLNWLATRGDAGWCPARLTGGGRRRFGVYLHLGDPDRIVPVNTPDGLELLEATATVTVSGEERHQDVLEPLLRDKPRAAIFTELRQSTVERGKYAGQACVEVAVDGQRVGQLTPTMSARYLTLVQAITVSGRRPGAEASLYRDAKGVQIRLHLPQAPKS